MERDLVLPLGTDWVWKCLVNKHLNDASVLVTARFQAVSYFLQLCVFRCDVTPHWKPCRCSCSFVCVCVCETKREMCRRRISTFIFSIKELELSLCVIILLVSKEAWAFTTTLICISVLSEVYYFILFFYEKILYLSFPAKCKHCVSVWFQIMTLWQRNCTIHL